ncbi:hypothetical protein B0H17DRAFT_1183174 [Mycena rosella]|uniref:Uncharacterized protein n=1 Tax=Mycena rosella TaxID=1033263 RepID=A0AAD7D123_MYCRO|nr:hypothetical protein B0H17DRAFT_1183174 [Mycena rosella]
MASTDSRTYPSWPSFKSRLAAEFEAEIQMLQNLQTANIALANLPPGFPSATFKMDRMLEWTEGGHRHPFQYMLRHVAPGAQYRAAKWRLYGNFPHYRVGYVEIDALIYEPTEPPVRDWLTSATMVLHLLKESLHRDRPIRLGYEVSAMAGYASSVERIVARTIPVAAIGEPSLEIASYGLPRSFPRRICVEWGCADRGVGWRMKVGDGGFFRSGGQCGVDGLRRLFTLRIISNTMQTFYVDNGNCLGNKESGELTANISKLSKRLQPTSIIPRVEAVESAELEALLPGCSFSALNLGSGIQILYVKYKDGWFWNKESDTRSSFAVVDLAWFRLMDQYEWERSLRDLHLARALPKSQRKK